jgi:hypothetical protein
MVSTVKARPNHYEVLRLTPDASEEEIARAFTRELSAPRAFGGLAEVGMAYETLRDPAKRRAHDTELGLKPEPEPEPEPQPQPAHSPAAPWEASRYFTRAAAHPAEQPAVTTLPRPEPQPQADTAAEHRPGPFIAAPDPSPPSRPKAERQRPRAEAAPNLEQLIEQLHAARQPGEQSAGEPKEQPIGWSRTGAIAGGAILATVLLGAWAGLEARDGEEPAEQAATVKLPAPTPLPAAPSAVAKSEPAAPVPVAPRRISHPVPPRQPAPSEDRLADISRSLESADTAADPATAEAPPVQPVAASLPLPNSIIARTIERIGYACGEVASTTSVEGATGVYNVTCTSGQSYRAVPVRGRYHFRRLGSR